MVTDGALGSRTAAMLAPYSDDASTSGIMTVEPEKLRALAIERDKAGFQLNFHAIGDRANRVAIDVFEAVAKANGPRDRRDRVEHAQVVAMSDFSRFARLQVIASCSHRMKLPTCAGPTTGWPRARKATPGPPCKSSVH
jgi:predicted amidohydrolase YtcJ